MSDDDLDKPATRRDIVDLRRHFDVVNENFKSEFKNLFDWAEATTSSTGAHVGGLERKPPTA